jgi:aerobic carbon-monoxide dehydrogenase medium subunit
MTEAAFYRPDSVEDAIALLQRHDGARPLAGGATLVAMLNARLVEPPALISLAGIAGLSGISRLADGTVRIGAMTRHSDTARSMAFEGGQRVVSAAALVIANPVVRNMGTMGGSVAFADPAADYLPALVAANAAIEIAGPGGKRVVPSGGFVLDWYTPALAPDEIITGFVVPPATLGSIGIFEKLDRTAGDFAIASVALILSLDGGICRDARIAIGGCGPGPVRRGEAEALLVGSPLDAATVARAGLLLAAHCDPVDDMRASAEYRRRIVPRLLAKTIARARAALDSLP